MKNFINLLTGIFILGILFLFYAYFIEPDRLVINKTQIQVKNWNAAFDGLKIVAISDIHAGSNSIDEEKLKTIVKKTNEQDPDLIVLLGDYGSHKNGNGSNLKLPLSKIAENLKGFKSKYGVFGVLGNHDLNGLLPEIKTHFERVGIKVLENELIFIEKGGEKLRIFGAKDHLYVNDWEMFADECRKILESNEQVGDVLVLEHSPDLFPVITGKNMISKDFKLMLAGHTHGGQVRLPFLGSIVVPSSYGQKYVRGHVKDKGVDMFVTTGVGTSILPIRFLVPPEIAVITIFRE